MASSLIKTQPGDLLERLQIKCGSLGQDMTKVVSFQAHQNH